MKIVESLEEFNLLIKCVSGTTKNHTNEQKSGFLSMLLGTLGASLLENLFASKEVIKAGEGTIRADQDFYCYPIL